MDRPLLPTSITVRGRINTAARWALRRCPVALGGLPLLLLSVTGPAAAQDGPLPNAGDGSTFVLELRTFAGGAALSLSDTDESTSRSKPVVDFDAMAWGAGARAGWNIDAHFQLGASASVVNYWRSGKLDMRNAQTTGDYFFQFDDTPTLWAPIGAFVEIHLWRDVGAFVGLAVSLGYVPPVGKPRPNSIDPEMYLAGYALEAGYDSSRSAPYAVGVFLRYSAWTGGESPLSTDFPEGLTLGELTIGARWAIRL